MLRRILLASTLTAGLAVLSAAALAADPAAKPDLLPNLGTKEPWYHALWVLIIFIVLLAVLYPTAWKNVLAGLKKREESIRADIAAAEAQRVKAEQTLKDYNAKLATAENQVRDMIGKAVQDGERAAAEIRLQATKEAEESRKRAMGEIESARKQAITDIYAQAATLSTQIAEKIIRRNLNADDQRDLVRRSLEELQTVQR